MKRMLCMAAAFCLLSWAQAQDIFSTRKGQVSFSGKTAMENIDATNNEVASALNAKTGELVFSLLVKGFHFERALMEEHFNENYMESDNIPKASFKGTIANMASVNLSKDGTYPVNGDGDITIHGVTKKISVQGTIVVKGGLPELTAKFAVAPKDYNIKIPSLVADKIASVMNVTVDCRYEKK